MSKPKRSEIVTALADVASQGTYQVKPEQARQINAIFDWTAQLINELEAEEKDEEARMNIVQEAQNLAALAAIEEEENDAE